VLGCCTHTHTNTHTHKRIHTRAQARAHNRTDAQPAAVLKGQRAEGMQVKDQRREGMQVRLRLTTTHHLRKLTMTHDIQVFIQDGNGAYAFVGDWDVFENLLDSDGLEPEVTRKMGPGCAPMGMPGRDSQTDRK